MTVNEALHARRATPSFDKSVTITREEVLALIDEASLAPSSMNMQPWEFLVIETDEDKAKLKDVAMNQGKVTEASAVIVVIGQLNAHLNAARVGQANIDAGFGSEEQTSYLVNATKAMWGDNPANARTEAFRGTSLWSMAFMLVAQQAGWDTAPMSGFFPDKLSEAFGIPDTHVPVMLICIGKHNTEVPLRPRGIRFPASELTHFGKF